MIKHDEFPYLIPSGTTYDSGNYHIVVDKLLRTPPTKRSKPSAKDCARKENLPA